MGRILHLGLGNFHRAHQALYTAKAGGWKITGVAFRNAALCDELAQSRGAYHLGIRGPGGLQVEKIDLHDRIILAATHPGDVISAIADSEVSVVTLTITEKGYHLLPETGALDLGNPLIQGDLRTDHPQTGIGYLAHGLAARAKAGAGAISIVSCDNISGNGKKLSAAIRDFAAAAELDLIAFLETNVAFPDTMVDRITPATTETLAGDISTAAGTEALSPVMTESFSEWVIEDDFAGDRPNWQDAGAEIVADVAPFEKRKLRLLNSSHSYLAYAGQLRGHEFVHQAIADPDLRAGVEALWDEAQETLPESVQTTTAAYRAALIERFSVPEMRHALAQIAMDGSLKIRERLSPIINERGAENSPASVSAIKSWLAFVQRALRTGVQLQDPNAEQIKELFGPDRDPEDTIAQVCDLIGLDIPREKLAPLLLLDIRYLRPQAAS